jgi:hypothetical protein
MLLIVGLALLGVLPIGLAGCVLMARVQNGRVRGPHAAPGRRPSVDQMNHIAADWHVR